MAVIAGESGAISRGERIQQRRGDLISRDAEREVVVRRLKSKIEGALRPRERETRERRRGRCLITGELQLNEEGSIV